MTAHNRSQPGFLPGAALSVTSFRRPSATCAREQATSTNPTAPCASLLSDAARDLAKATCVAAAASLLAFSSPSLSPDTVLHPSAAHATGRGGGASFTSASGSVNKDPESLLRWSLPIDNSTVRQLQQELEQGMSELKGLKWNNVDGHVKKATLILNKQVPKILSSVPEARRSECSSLLDGVSTGISDGLQQFVLQKNADKYIALSKSLLRDIGTVEQAMVTGFPYSIPDEYATLPALKGRANVEMVVEKQGDENFDIGGIFYKQGKLKLTLDGYSAPISAGNFLDLVNKGFYNKMTIIRSDGFIIQSGKPEGYTDKATGKTRFVPLEIFAKGDKKPIYGTSLEDDGRGAESTVLPFTSYGTLAVARNEFEPNSASSQFFWFLFEPDLTPAGRNLMDGNWAVFGYTIEGEEYLRQVQKDDIIVSAKVTGGLENLENAA